MSPTYSGRQYQRRHLQEYNTENFGGGFVVCVGIDTLHRLLGVLLASQKSCLSFGPRNTDILRCYGFLSIGRRLPRDSLQHVHPTDPCSKLEGLRKMKRWPCHQIYTTVSYPSSQNRHAPSFPIRHHPHRCKKR